MDKRNTRSRNTLLSTITGLAALVIATTPANAQQVAPRSTIAQHTLTIETPILSGNFRYDSIPGQKKLIFRGNHRNFSRTTSVQYNHVPDFDFLPATETRDEQLSSYLNRNAVLISAPGDSTPIYILNDALTQERGRLKESLEQKRELSACYAGVQLGTRTLIIEQRPLQARALPNGDEPNELHTMPANAVPYNPCPQRLGNVAFSHSQIVRYDDAIVNPEEDTNSLTPIADVPCPQDDINAFLWDLQEDRPLVYLVSSPEKLHVMRGVHRGRTYSRYDQHSVVSFTNGRFDGAKAATLNMTDQERDPAFVLAEYAKERVRITQTVTFASFTSAKPPIEESMWQEQRKMAENGPYGNRSNVRNTSYKPDAQR